jgi:hypothetical protein
MAVAETAVQALDTDFQELQTLVVVVAEHMAVTKVLLQE